jgi:hypothetical protein
VKYKNCRLCPRPSGPLLRVAITCYSGEQWRCIICDRCAKSFPIGEKVKCRVLKEANPVEIAKGNP